MGDSMNMPKFPKPDRNGCRPMIESVWVVMAQQLIKDRKQAGLSQIELAKRAGLRQETISRIESGKVTPTIKTMQALEKVLV